MSSEDEIGGRVLAVRNGAGLDQRAFAARIGSSSGRVSEIENGKSLPGAALLARLHAEFDVDLNWLITGQRTANTAPAPALSRREAALLDNYRHSPEDAKTAIDKTSAAFAQPHALTKRSPTKKTTARQAATSDGGAVQHFHEAVDQVAGRDIVNSPRRKR